MAAPSWNDLLKPGEAEDCFVDRPAEGFDATGGTRLVDVWWCAELSRLAYRDRDRDACLRDTRLGEVAAFGSRGSVVLLVGPRDSAAAPFTIVVFRGTDELRDWAANVRALPVRWGPGGNVHRGFRRSLAKVWLPLRRTLRGRPGPVFCAGHSLGGAMALLAGSALRARAVHTFGAPRTGDEGFARSLAGVTVLRCEHGRDLVPRLRIPGYRHVGEGIHLGRPADDGDVELRPDWWRSWHDLAAYLADHAPVAYVRALRQRIDADGA